jgi:hypothetical protein
VPQVARHSRLRSAAILSVGARVGGLWPKVGADLVEMGLLGPVLS